MRYRLVNWFDQFTPEKIKVIGTGGYGEVWEGRLHGKPVAIKYLIDLSQEGRTNFAREVAQLEQLKGEPYVVQLFDQNLFASAPYYCMELCAGTLANLSGTIPRARHPELLLHLTRAFSGLHKRGLHHRDIKPTNILLRNEDGHLIPVVSDFGIARTIHTRTPCHGTGTPVYTAPEMLLGPPEFISAADIYSLGITMYEVITGRPERPWLNTAVANDLNALLLRMTAPDSGSRPSYPMIEQELQELISYRAANPILGTIASATGTEMAIGVAAVGLGLSAILGKRSA